LRYFVLISPLRPLASTRYSNWTMPVEPSALRLQVADTGRPTGTSEPTAGSSNWISVTFVRSKTCAPHSSACRNRISSACERTTFHAWPSGPLAATKSVNAGGCDWLSLKAAPFLFMNPKLLNLSSAPMKRRKCRIEGSRDSPMWYRGCWSASSITTSWPSRASEAAAKEPAGPPPMTRTVHLVGTSMLFVTLPIVCTVYCNEL
jgi:hypothetical protein